MKLIKAIVTTNSEDDPLMRVKLSSPTIWQEESELLPSLNSIYLEKKDVVLVMFDTLANPIILGKYNSFEQENPVSGQVLFSAKKDSDWIVGTLFSKELAIESSNGFKAYGFFKDLRLQTPDGSELLYEDNRFLLRLNKGAVIESDGENIIVNSKTGKVSIENESNNLYTLLDDLLSTLSTTMPTTQGSPAAHNFNPAISSKLAEVKTKLGLLMK